MARINRPVLFRNLMPMAVLMSLNVLARGQSMDRMVLFYRSNALPSMHALQHAQLIGQCELAGVNRPVLRGGAVTKPINASP